MSKQFHLKQLSLALRQCLVLFNPYIGPYQVLRLRAKLDLGTIALKGYSVFPEALASPSNCLESYQDTRWGVYYSSAEMQSVYSATPVDWVTPTTMIEKSDLFKTPPIYLLNTHRTKFI